MNIILKILASKLCVGTWVIRSRIAQPLIAWEELEVAPIDAWAAWLTTPSSSSPEGILSPLVAQGEARDFVPNSNLVPAVTHEQPHTRMLPQDQSNHQRIRLINGAQFENNAADLTKDPQYSSLDGTDNGPPLHGHQVPRKSLSDASASDPSRISERFDVYSGLPHHSQHHDYEQSRATQPNLAHKRAIHDNNNDLKPPRKRGRIAAAKLTVPPGGDPSFWFWGLSGRPTIIRAEHNKYSEDFIAATRNFCHSFRASNLYEPTASKDLLQGVPVRFVSTGTFDNYNNHLGCVRVMNSEVQVLSLNPMARRLQRLLTWVFHYHAALLERWQVSNQEIAQDALWRWLWKMFHQPRNGSLPVIGPTTREKFYSAARNNIEKFGMSQRWFIAYLTHSEGELILDETAIGLIFNWYTSKDSFMGHRFNSESEFWDNILQAVPLYLQKHVSNQSRLKWSPMLEVVPSNKATGVTVSAVKKRAENEALFFELMKRTVSQKSELTLLDYKNKI